MVQITDVMLKKLLPGSKPVSDATVPGLRYEPGAVKGQGKWILRFVSPITGKRRDMGLGTYPEVGIKDARGRALEARKLIGNGQDPIDERANARAVAKAHADEMTFETAAREVHEGIKSGWKSAKHADQWINTLETYVFPKKWVSPSLTLSDMLSGCHAGRDSIPGAWCRLPANVPGDGRALP